MPDHIIPVDRVMPMKVVSIETHDSPDGLVFVYNVKRDRIQEHLMVQRMEDRENAGQILIATHDVSFSTRTPLNVGVGEYFTIDLVPFTPQPVPEDLRERNNLEAFLRSLMED